MKVCQVGPWPSVLSYIARLSSAKVQSPDSATLSMAPGYVVNRDNQQLLSEERKLMPTAEKVKITCDLSHK